MSPPVWKSTRRSWNWPWISPHIFKGAESSSRMGWEAKISFAFMQYFFLLFLLCLNRFNFISCRRHSSKELTLSSAGPALFAGSAATFCCGSNFFYFRFYAFAFFCLLFVSSKALQDLGIFAGISVAIAALFSLIVLPHFIKRDNSKIPQPEKKSWIENILAYPFEKNKYLILFILTFTIVAFIFSGKYPKRLF